MAKSPVLGAAFGLFAVWWGLSFVAFLTTGRIWSGEEWMEASTQAWASLFGGALLGLGGTAAVVIGARQWRIARLTGDNVRGVVCSIGPLPINFDRPAEAEEMPQAAQLRLPGADFDPDGKIDRDWMEKWFVKYEQFYPEHAALMRAVARVLNSKPKLPAACKKLAKGVKRYQYGFDEHMHGDHTLVEHSWVCGSVGIWLAEHGYEYTGMQFQNRDKKDIGFLPRKNEKYEFKAFDPLIGLMCFAHDIGKIETFRVNEEGTVEVIEPAHDSVGARMLARMDEFWALPFEDRMTLTLAIGHYHKPNQIPLRRDEESPNKAEALSDRTMAMLSLVMLADREAGAIENKKSVLNGENQPKEIKEEEYRENLWLAFKDLLSESQRIHTDPSRYRIGQKNTTSTGTLITLKEGDLRKALLDKMELRKSVKESTTDNGSVQITEDLLEVLDDKGCLVKEAGGVTVSAKEAIWKVEFLGKDKSKAGEVIATWPYTILINPEEHFPRLASAPDAQSIPRVTQLADRSAMGEERKPRKQPGLDALTEGPLLDADGVPVIPEGTKSKKAKKGQADSRTRESQSQEPVGKVVDLGDARNQKVKRAEGEPDKEEVAAVPKTVQQEARPPTQTATASQGQRSSTADFLDDADPVEAPTTGGEADGTQQTGMPKSNVDIVQGLLRSKLQEAAGVVEQQRGEEAAPTNVEKKSAEVIAALPQEIVALAASLRSLLVKIQSADRSGKLAGDVLDDGRKAYSMDALKATVPEVREKLDDVMLRKLMAAGKLGPHVPVCLTYRRETGVILLMVNEQALKTISARGPLR